MPNAATSLENRKKAKVDLTWRQAKVLLYHDDDDIEYYDDHDPHDDHDDDDAAGPGASVSWCGLARPIYQGVDPP